MQSENKSEKGKTNAETSAHANDREIDRPCERRMTKQPTSKGTQMFWKVINESMHVTLFVRGHLTLSKQKRDCRCCSVPFFGGLVVAVVFVLGWMVWTIYSFVVSMCKKKGQWKYNTSLSQSHLIDYHFCRRFLFGRVLSVCACVCVSVCPFDVCLRASVCMSITNDKWTTHENTYKHYSLSITNRKIKYLHSRTLSSHR